MYTYTSNYTSNYSIDGLLLYWLLAILPHWYANYLLLRSNKKPKSPIVLPTDKPAETTTDPASADKRVEHIPIATEPEIKTTLNQIVDTNAEISADKLKELSSDLRKDSAVFVASVVLGTLAGINNDFLNGITLSYILLRVFYTGFYLWGTSHLRKYWGTVSWYLSLGLLAWGIGEAGWVLRDSVPVHV